MKRTASLFLAMLTIGSVLFAGGRGAQESARAGQVVIWTYDSFTSEWGPGPSVSADFK